MSKKRALVMAICVGVAGFFMHHLTEGNDLWVRALAAGAVVGLIVALFTGVGFRVRRRENGEKRFSIRVTRDKADT